MSVWDKIKSLFSRKDKPKKGGEQGENPTATNESKNGYKKDEQNDQHTDTNVSKTEYKKGPRPYETVDVNESGAELKTEPAEPNQYQKAPHKPRPYDEVDVNTDEGGGVQVHEQG